MDLLVDTILKGPARSMISSMTRLRRYRSCRRQGSALQQHMEVSVIRIQQSALGHLLTPTHRLEWAYRVVASSFPRHLKAHELLPVSMASKRMNIKLSKQLMERGSSNSPLTTSHSVLSKIMAIWLSKPWPLQRNPSRLPVRGASARKETGQGGKWVRQEATG